MTNQPSIGPRALSNINSLWAALMVEELYRCGVGFFSVSPGSRSTPLAVAVAEHPFVQSTVHFDERGAAFCALGWAKASGRPAALICTSGTAAANYLPAVMEASMSRVPLIVLTADRPPELLDTGANQTVNQTHLYGEYARWSFALPCPERTIGLEFLLTTMDQAVHRARSVPEGPVHLNCPFREPLAPVVTGELLDAVCGRISGWLNRATPYTAYSMPRRTAQEGDVEAFSKWARGGEGIILAGALESEADAHAVRLLARKLEWPVFPDVASGLRLGKKDFHLVRHYDQALHAVRFRDALRGRAILHVGGPITSKRLLQHLEVLRPERYLLVTDHPRRHDPSHLVHWRIESEVKAFCDAASATVSDGQGKLDVPMFATASARVNQAFEAHFQAAGPLSEPGVARLISKLAPEGSGLMLGNSMPIRDMDMFGCCEGPGLRVCVNRGASGIDGLVATAAGYALGSGKPVTAVLGDLSALHDLSSWPLLRRIPVTLVIINNDGGGIFSFLPVAGCGDWFDTFFAASHGLRFQAAAEMFGLPYHAPRTPGEFESVYKGAVGCGQTVVIEVATQREENHRLHQALGQIAAGALES